MSRVSNLLSPQKTSGALLASIAVHGLIYGGVLASVGVGWFERTETPPPQEVTVDYQVFDEPPNTPHQEEAADDSPDEPEEAPKVVDHSPHELQDTKSDVAGTQTAAPKPVKIAGATSGTVANTPFYRIKPKYPRSALVAGTEGWILMKIDITEGGEVENVRIVDGENRNVFQDEAKKAVTKWKYKPFTDDAGKPIKKADQQVRVDFKLADA